MTNKYLSLFPKDLEIFDVLCFVKALYEILIKAKSDNVLSCGFDTLICLLFLPSAKFIGMS